MSDFWKVANSTEYSFEQKVCYDTTSFDSSTVYEYVERIINDIEDFDWETMTEEEYSMYLNWLSKGNIMQSWFQIPTSMCSE